MMSIQLIPLLLTKDEPRCAPFRSALGRRNYPTHQCRLARVQNRQIRTRRNWKIRTQPIVRPLSRTIASARLEHGYVRQLFHHRRRHFGSQKRGKIVATLEKVYNLL